MSRPLFRPRITLLEQRDLPSAVLTPFDGNNLTLDFAADGTNVVGSTSSFFQNFQPNVNAAETAVLAAFQTWADAANLNFGLVASSSAGGSTPYEDANLAADVHINALPLSTGVGAISTPLSSNTAWAGNMLLNTLQSFSYGEQSGQYDLYTVALHETGILLGLPESSNPASVMYTQYTGPRGGLSAVDIAAIQAIYGAPPLNTVGGGNGNETLANAANISQGQTITATLLSTTDVDYYKFSYDPNQGGDTITLQTAGYSLLTPQIEVVNSAGTVVSQASATDPRNNNLTLKLSNLPNGNYYVDVSGANNSVFGMGSYQISLADHHDVLNGAQNAANQAQNAAQDAANQAQNAQQQATQAAQQATQQAAQAAQNPSNQGAQTNATNAEALAISAARTAQATSAAANATAQAAALAEQAYQNAQNLTQDTVDLQAALMEDQLAQAYDQTAKNAGHPAQIQTPTVNMNNTTAASGDLLQSNQLDTYQIQTPNAQQAGSQSNLVVTVVAAGNVGLNPNLMVLENNNVVSSTVLVNNNGKMTVLIPNAVNQNYLVEVSSSTGSTGIYQFTYQLLSNQAVTALQFEGQLNGSTTSTTGSLQITQYQVVHFVLAGYTSNDVSSTEVQMNVLDSNNNCVASLTVTSGSVQSLDVQLSPGNYVIEIDAISPNGSAIEPIDFSLTVYVVSNAVSVAAANPTASTSTSSTQNTTSNTTATTSSTQTSTTTTTSTATSNSSILGFWWQTTPTGGTVNY